MVRTLSFLAFAVLLGVAAFLFLAGADFLADLALAGGSAAATVGLKGGPGSMAQPQACEGSPAKWRLG